MPLGNPANFLLRSLAVGCALRPCQRDNDIIVMDPASIVGLASGALQIGQVLLDVITRLNWFYRYVRDGPKQSKELRHEIDTLLDVLKDVEAAFESSQPPQSVQEEILTMEGLLNHLKTRTNLKNACGVRRITWPFSQKENGEIINKIEHFKSAMNLSLNSLLVYQIGR